MQPRFYWIQQVLSMVKNVTSHPFVKNMIQQGKATDKSVEIDRNIYTAQTENTLHLLLPEVVKILKE